MAGGAGNDWFHGLRGGDTFTGGEGNDTYFWQAKDVANAKGASRGVDTITDFDTGDILDFSALIDRSSDKSLADLVQLTEVETASGTNTMVSVALGGKAGLVDVVMLVGQQGLDIDEIVADEANFV